MGGRDGFFPTNDATTLCEVDLHDVLDRMRCPIGFRKPILSHEARRRRADYLLWDFQRNASDKHCIGVALFRATSSQTIDLCNSCLLPIMLSILMPYISMILNRLSSDWDRRENDIIAVTLYGIMLMPVVRRENAPGQTCLSKSW